MSDSGNPGGLPRWGWYVIGAIAFIGGLLVVAGLFS